MSKSKRLLLSGCLILVAALVAVSSFTLRQVLMGGLALLIIQFADEQFKAAFTPRPFIRYQFKIAIHKIGEALQAAGLYDDELAAATDAIAKGMTGNGWITFTWLESELFFVNTTNQFGAQLEFSIDLPAYGSRQSQRALELSDLLEMRMTSAGYYELVLLTREQRYFSHSMRGIGLVLFRLPYKFLWALQGDPYDFGRHDKVKSILAEVGLTYWADPEFLHWEYKNEYGTLRWWDV